LSKTTIKSILSKLLYDRREKPEEYYIAFKKGTRAIIVPLTFLKINLKEGYFKFQDNLIPLHKIIGIKHERMGWLLLRPVSMPIIPYDIELPSFDVPISIIFDDFDLQRFFPLLCRKIINRLELLDRVDTIFESPEEKITIQMVRSSDVLNGSFIISRGASKFFLRSIPKNPPPLSKFFSKLTPFHRITLYSARDAKIAEIRILLDDLTIKVMDNRIELIKNHTRGNNIALFLNDNSKLFMAYSLNDCKFLGQISSFRSVNPVLERISPQELKWHLRKKDLLAVVYDYDKVFMSM